MTATMPDATVAAAIERVTVAPADTEVRITRRIEIGHCVMQGDIYIHRVEESHPTGELIGKGMVQIALGTGNGARHVAEGQVEVYKGEQLPEWVKPLAMVEAKEITGPVILAHDTFAITHPEHPHHQLPAGKYQVTYQFNPKTMKRVVD